VIKTPLSLFGDIRTSHPPRIREWSVSTRCTEPTDATGEVDAFWCMTLMASDGNTYCAAITLPEAEALFESCGERSVSAQIFGNLWRRGILPVPQPPAATGDDAVAAPGQRESEGAQDA